MITVESYLLRCHRSDRSHITPRILHIPRNKLQTKHWARSSRVSDHCRRSSWQTYRYTIKRKNRHHRSCWGRPRHHSKEEELPTEAQNLLWNIHRRKLLETIFSASRTHTPPTHPLVRPRPIRDHRLHCSRNFQRCQRLLNSIPIQAVPNRPLLFRCNNRCRNWYPSRRSFEW